MDTKQQSLANPITTTSDWGETQPQTHGPQTESQPTPTSAEALVTQTSINTEVIVAQVVTDINAATEEEIVGNEGGKPTEKAKVMSSQTHLFSSNLQDFVWIKIRN